MKDTKIKIFIIIAVVLTLFIVFQRSIDHDSSVLKISGNIEATEVRLAFRIPGKIKELLFDEGSEVNKNSVVARLEIDELTKLKDQSEAALQSAEFNYKQTKNDYERLENLFNAGAISAQKRDMAKTLYSSSKANVDALKASFELASTRLGFSELISPINGFIITKSAEISEVVQAGATIFIITDLNDIWLTAYINEKDLGRIKLNQEINVKTDTFTDKIYKGKISFISQTAEFTPKQIQTTEERVKLVYRIKIKIDNINQELKPGMPADGFINFK